MSDVVDPPAPAARRPVARSRRRGVLFRVLAIALGLAPFLVCEAALRVLGIGEPDPRDDPFVGFAAIRPLFELDPSGTRYETSPARRLYFRPQSFPAVKAPNAFRIFCLGGSTVQGRPYAVETSFTTWLALSLKAADLARDWQVVNCGGISYASYRLVPILEEVLRYQPDLIILYTGHNEFLEDRTYSHFKRLPGAVRWAVGAASDSRTFRVLRSGAERLGWVGRPSRQINQDRPILRAEVDALLDYRGGLEWYHRDDRWRQGVIDHYELNLRRMIALCRRAGVPVMLANPVVNLETPPFKSEHRPGLTSEELARFNALWEAARARYSKSLPAAVALLRQALAIDDQHAGLWYTFGRCAQELGQLDEARDALERARDLDICPLRTLGPMNRIVLNVARDTGTPLVDIVRLFADRSEGGITGDDWLVDHVHPSIPGHQLIAEAMYRVMVRQGWAPPPGPSWAAERDRLYAAHLASLDTLYYLKGQQRLRNLENWARGRSPRLRSQGPIAEDPLEDWTRRANRPPSRRPPP
ncbi:MAG: tetratricopeptide repeat protein, partial [Isosphaeraceae bacterium]|nr:tetratricopeptide repeat protein [Isosphaeraceae bacterium]